MTVDHRWYSILDDLEAHLQYQAEALEAGQFELIAAFAVPPGLGSMPPNLGPRYALLSARSDELIGQVTERRDEIGAAAGDAPAPAPGRRGRSPATSTHRPEPGQRATTTLRAQVGRRLTDKPGEHGSLTPSSHGVGFRPGVDPWCSDEPTRCSTASATCPSCRRWPTSWWRWRSRRRATSSAC